MDKDSKKRLSLVFIGYTILDYLIHRRSRENIVILQYVSFLTEYQWNIQNISYP